MKDIFQEEHNIFRQNVRKFVKTEINPISEEFEQKAEFPKHILPKLGDLGYLGLRFPVKYGGAESDVLMSVVLAEEFAYADSMSIGNCVMIHTEMSSNYVNNFGTEEQKKRYLIPAIKGEIFCGVAVSEASGGSDVSAIQTTAKRDGDYYVISGNKMFITNSSQGDVLIVAAKTDPGKRHKGISLFILETSTPGYEASKLKKMMWKPADTGVVSLDNCRVPVENLLGEEDKGFKHIMQCFEMERLLLSIMAVTGAQRAFDEARKYAGERIQFGKPIRSFQAISHKLADMEIQVEAGRQLAYHAALLLNDGEECKKEVTISKVFTCEMAYRVASDAVQIHGGYGLMEEYLVSRLYRDLRAFSIGGGTSEIMREELAKGMWA